MNILSNLLSLFGSPVKTLAPVYGPPKPIYGPPKITAFGLQVISAGQHAARTPGSRAYDEREWCLSNLGYDPYDEPRMHPAPFFRSVDDEMLFILKHGGRS